MPAERAQSRATHVVDARTRTATEWPEHGNRRALRWIPHDPANHHRVAEDLFEGRTGARGEGHSRIPDTAARPRRFAFHDRRRPGSIMTAIVPHPLALIAELTHRCPLHCVYCSNPLELKARGVELPTEVWTRVLGDAAEAGVLQVDFTGGEPLARPDLVELVRAARTAGLYVSLITSGLPLDERRLADLVNAGLDHLQLSFQGLQEDAASEIAGTRALE